MQLIKAFVLIVAITLLVMAVLQGILPVWSWFKKRRDESATEEQKASKKWGKYEVAIAVTLFVLVLSGIIFRHWFLSSLTGNLVGSVVIILLIRTLMTWLAPYLVKEEAEQDKVIRFLPIFVAFFLSTLVMINWTESYALEHNLRVIPWIIIAGVDNILLQIAWWHVARPFGFRPAATHWPKATACLTAAIVMVAIFTHLETKRQNIFPGYESIEEAVIKSICPYNGILHEREIVYTGEKMKRYKHCEICSADMTPVTPDYVFGKLVLHADPDHLPAELGAYADSLFGYPSADSTGADEAPDTTDTIMPQQGMIKPPSNRSPIFHLESPGPSRWRTFALKFDGGTMTWLLLIVAFVLGMTVKAKYRMANVLVVVIVWMVCCVLNLWPSDLVGVSVTADTDQAYAAAGSGTTSVPLPFASFGLASTGSLSGLAGFEQVKHGVSWLSGVVPGPILIVMLLLLLMATTRFQGRLRFFFILGVLSLPLLIRLFGYGRPWRSDGTSLTRYELFPYLVILLAIFFIVFGVRRAIRNKWGFGTLVGYVLAAATVSTLTWMLLGIQPYGSGPNQHTLKLARVDRAVAAQAWQHLDLSKAEFVGLNVRRDQRRVRLAKGSRVWPVYVDDKGRGILVRDGVYTSRAHRENMPPEAQKDLWRVPDAPMFWPVIWTEQESRFSNPISKAVPLYDGEPYEVLEDEILMFGLNINTTVESIMRDPMHTGSWTVTYIIEQPKYSSLVKIGLAQ